MKKQTLQQQLIAGHEAYATYVLSLSERDFNFALPEKWNAGQHLKHILISVTMLNKAIDNPKFIASLAEREPKRAAMNYNELVSFYMSKINEGAKATPPFVPDLVTINERAQLVKDVQTTIAELCVKLNAYTEKELDTLTIPHPLLKRLSLREMIYFTIKHAEHHYELTKQYIQ